MSLIFKAKMVMMLDKPFETEELLFRVEQLIAGTLETWYSGEFSMDPKSNKLCMEPDDTARHPGVFGYNSAPSSEWLCFTPPLDDPPMT